MEGTEEFRRVSEDSARLSRLEPIREVMSEASGYYGNAMLGDVDEIARGAWDDPVSAMCLGRMLIVGEESERDILAAAELFEAASDELDVAEEWLMFLGGDHPGWVIKGEARRREFGMGPFRMPDPEWGVLQDLCAMPHSETAYKRFRNADGGFENSTFMTRPELQFESALGFRAYPKEEWLRVTFMFKPTGFAYRCIQADEEDAELLRPVVQRSASQGISCMDAAHMLRLCIDSAIRSIREGCA